MQAGLSRHGLAVDDLRRSLGAQRLVQLAQQVPGVRIEPCPRWRGGQRALAKVRNEEAIAIYACTGLF